MQHYYRGKYSAKHLQFVWIITKRIVSDKCDKHQRRDKHNPFLIELSYQIPIERISEKEEENISLRHIKTSPRQVWAAHIQDLMPQSNTPKTTASEMVSAFICVLHFKVFANRQKSKKYTCMQNKEMRNHAPVSGCNANSFAIVEKHEKLSRLTIKGITTSPHTRNGITNETNFFLMKAIAFSFMTLSLDKLAT